MALRDKQYLLAIDFGGTKVAIVLIDYDGNKIKSKKLIIAGMDGVRILKIVLKICDEMVGDHNDELLCIGISTIGIVTNEHLKLVPTIKNWNSINLRAAFKKVFPNTLIYIENDVKAAAYGELLNGALKNTTNGIYLNLGTGVAIGLTLGNLVIKGKHGAAGEIGYLLDPFDHRNDNFSSGHAPFEEIAGGKGIAEQINEENGASMNVKTFWEGRFEEGSSMSQLKERIFDNLGYQLSNLCITWDPEVVAIGGGMEAQFKQISERLEPALTSNVPFPPILKPAYYKQDASLNGIIQLILNKC